MPISYSYPNEQNVLNISSNTGKDNAPEKANERATKKA